MRLCLSTSGSIDARGGLTVQGSKQGKIGLKGRIRTGQSRTGRGDPLVQTGSGRDGQRSASGWAGIGWAGQNSGLHLS